MTGGSIIKIVILLLIQVCALDLPDLRGRRMSMMMRVRKPEFHIGRQYTHINPI